MFLNKKNSTRTELYTNSVLVIFFISSLSHRGSSFIAIIY